MGEHNSDERTQHPWKSMAALANASMEKLAAAEQTSARQRERASMAAPRGIVAAPSWDFLHGVSERNAHSHGAMLEIEEDSGLPNGIFTKSYTSFLASTSFLLQETVSFFFTISLQLIS
jgi:hypothetical protein